MLIQLQGSFIQVYIQLVQQSFILDNLLLLSIDSVNNWFSSQPIIQESKLNYQFCWSSGKLKLFLHRLKCMVLSSPFYKICRDVISAHKNRSYFKKIYVKQQAKQIINPKIRQMAKIYQCQSTWLMKTQNSLQIQYCLPFATFSDTQQANMSQPLEQSQIQNQLPFYQFNCQLEYTQVQSYPCKAAIYNNNDRILVEISKCTSTELEYEYTILSTLSTKIRFLPTYFFSNKYPNLRIFQSNEFMIPLIDFLRINSRFISLMTKLKIMMQICQNLSHLHTQGIYYFLQPEFIYISENCSIKFINLTTAYRVLQPIVPIRLQNRNFPHINYENSELSNQKCDVYSLGTILYLILMQSYPFHINQFTKKHFNSISNEYWMSAWVVQTQHFLMQGGYLAKILGNVILRCLNLQDINQRPYVEWLVVILHQMIKYMNNIL